MTESPYRQRLSTELRPSSLPAIVAYWQRREAASQRALTRALHENRVRDECLEIAMKALEHYATFPINLLAQCTLDEIKQRLAQLEPEEKTG